jgi:hypothetical protein
MPRRPAVGTARSVARRSAQPDAHRLPGRAPADGRRRRGSRTSATRAASRSATVTSHARSCARPAIGEAEVPSLIDEIPIIAMLAAVPRATTVIEGAGELRVKESDRICALVANLRAIGVPCAESSPTGSSSTGPTARSAGVVRATHDHRIAMAFGVLARRSPEPTSHRRPRRRARQLPGVLDRCSASGGRMIIAIDGPAGSGKSRPRAPSPRGSASGTSTRARSTARSPGPRCGPAFRPAAGPRSMPSSSTRFDVRARPDGEGSACRGDRM